MPERANFDAQQYDGEQRSHWRYHFHENESECWGDALDADATVQACDGWLTTYNGSGERAVRFTAWSGDSYVYEEDGTAKTVTLTQYDDRTSTAGGADFTKLENMGWNLKGLPWLVSTYQTSPQAADGTYQMQVPHVIYSSLDGTANARYGQFYTAQSWAAGATLSLSNAFFTQTAAIGPEETVTFKLPVYSGTTVAPARQQVGIAALDDDADATRADDDSFCSFDDVVDVYPQADAPSDMTYSLGSDGLKWMAFDPQLPQLYVTTAQGTRLALASQAPVGIVIPLGVHLPDAGRYVIALPSAEAYADQEAVWLIDHEAGTATNLLTSDYTFLAGEGGDIATRMALMFGSEPSPLTSHPSSHRGIVKVAARYGRLPLQRLGFTTGSINIYSPDGTLVYSGEVSQFNGHLPDGVYIVKPQ